MPFTLLSLFRFPLERPSPFLLYSILGQLCKERERDSFSTLCLVFHCCSCVFSVRYHLLHNWDHDTRVKEKNCIPSSLLFFVGDDVECLMMLQEPEWDIISGQMPGNKIREPTREGPEYSNPSTSFLSFCRHHPLSFHYLLSWLLPGCITDAILNLLMAVLSSFLPSCHFVISNLVKEEGENNRRSLQERKVKRNKEDPSDDNL